MEATWPKALAWVLESEKGNDDDPHDTGGRTSDGITQREYSAYCEITGVKGGDVWECPMGIKVDIYHRSYWLPYGPILPPGPDYVFFDECVNAGLHEAVLILQRALAVSADGHIGIVTSAALSRTQDMYGLVRRMGDERAKVYQVTRGFRRFGKGWINRVHFCEKNALTLVQQ